MERCSRYSFRPSLLQRSLPAGILDHVATRLSLQPQGNPQMLVRVRDSQDLRATREAYAAWIRDLDALREKTPARTGGEGTAECVCSVYARLVEVARLSGDTALMERLNPVYDVVAKFKSGPDVVVRFTRASFLLPPFASDALAFSDACLARYAARGDADALEHGLHVLKRANTLFSTGTPGALGAIPADRAMPEAAWTARTTVTDGTSASLTGTNVRLLVAYSRLFADTQQGATLGERAKVTVGLFAPLTSIVKSGLGSLAFAMAQESDDHTVFTTGPQAVAWATKLQPRYPHTMCLPAVGPVRKDLQRGGTGVWLVTTTEVKGPFTMEVALKGLPGSALANTATLGP